jgi:thiol-disulfide isomerase/thioredoxin
MIIPKNLENLAEYVEKGKHVFFFTADWCGDCRFIKPVMPEIEAAHPAYTFVEVDRDLYLDIAIEWGIMGIPSFVVIEEGKEMGRLVNKLRKTKDEINDFLTGVETYASDL